MSPDPAEQGRTLDGRKHLLRLCTGYRRQVENDILEDLYINPAQPEHHQVTQFGFRPGADDQLQPRGQLFLDQEPERFGYQVLAHGLHRGPHGIAVAEIDGHTAHIAFVHNFLGVGFDDHGIADGLGGLDRFFSGCDHPPGGHRNAIGSQNAKGLVGRQVRATGRFGGFYKSARTAGIHILKRLHHSDRTGSDLVVADQIGQCPGGHTGQAKARHTAGPKDLEGVGPLAFIGHQIADQGFDALLVDRRDLPGDAFGVHEKGRDKVDQDRVKLVVAHHGIQTGAVMIGRSRGQDIHWIVDRGFRIEGILEQTSGFFRKGGDLEAGTDQDVGGNDRRTAGVGDDPNPLAFGYRLGGERRSGIDHLPFVGKREHAGLLEDQIGSQIRFGQSAGV